MEKTYVYIGLMALTTFLTRFLPLALVKGRIESSFVRSFLYYVPYVTLAVMTFPAVLDLAPQPWMGLCAFLLGILVSWKTSNLFLTSLVCSASVLILSLL